MLISRLHYIYTGVRTEREPSRDIYQVGNANGKSICWLVSGVRKGKAIALMLDRIYDVFNKSLALPPYGKKLT